MEMVQFLDSRKKHLGNDIFLIIHGPENVNLMINTFVMMIVMKCMKLKSSLLRKMSLLQLKHQSRTYSFAFFTLKN